MFCVYKFLTTLLAPFLRLYIAWRVKKGKEDPDRCNERFGIASKERPQGNLVMMHAVSVGESLSLLPLIKALQAKHEDLHILVTTTTLSSMRLMEKLLPDGCFHQFNTIDVPAWVKRFHQHWHPDIVLWAEQEIWPNILQEIKQQNTPMWLVNASLSQHSFERWFHIKKTARKVFSLFDTIFPKSQTDADRLSKFGLTNLGKIANLKYAGVALNCDAKALSDLRKSLGNRPFWVAVSTHPGEETLLEQTHLEVLKVFPDAVCIIAPRHVERATQIIAESGLKCQQRTKEPTIRKDTQLYIANTMGELGVFFELANLAFIGGSLVPIGGHNIIEPAKQMCVPIVGPYVNNCADLVEDFKAANACIMVANKDELAKVIIKYLRDDSELKTLAENGLNLIASQMGIVDTYVQMIEQHLGY